MRFENTEVWGFKHALKGMRNALESWENGDTEVLLYKDAYHPMVDLRNGEVNKCFSIGNDVIHVKVGANDLKLAQTLISAGGSHSKFMRMIHVATETNMPRYWWSEADTYHFNTKNSCSTMHRLLNNTKPITLDMFIICEEDKDWWLDTVDKLEQMRKEYKEIQATTKNSKEMIRLLVRAKRMLPEGFLQMRTWDTNYAELRNMYFQRKNHKLHEEWVDKFCKWVESLPYAKELICFDGKERAN